MSDTATITEPTISDAKAWCLEARKYLGLNMQPSEQVKKHAKGVASDLKSRAKDVAKKLEKIKKDLNSTKKKAKSPIDEEQYRAYETQFKSIGKALLVH